MKTIFMNRNFCNFCKCVVVFINVIIYFIFTFESTSSCITFQHVRLRMVTCIYLYRSVCTIRILVHCLPAYRLYIPYFDSIWKGCIIHDMFVRFVSFRPFCFPLTLFEYCIMLNMIHQGGVGTPLDTSPS